MRKGIIVAIAVLAFLTGCNMGDDTSKVPVKPKWQGARYHIALDTKSTKPNPAGITIPVITFIANPETLETRASLIVRFEAPGMKKDGPVKNQMVMAPADIHGAEGALPADYMDAADKNLSAFLKAYHVKGKVKLNVALARSSLSSQPGDAELNAKLLSDWLPVEVVFPNPHPAS